MSLDFDGSNDCVSLAAVTTGTARTFLVWFNHDTEGQGPNLGTFAAAGGFGKWTLEWNNANAKKLWYRSLRSGTQGRWEMTSGFAALNTWHGVVVTYDGSSTSNDPIFYTLEYPGSAISTLTVGSGLTEVSTPTGTENADPNTLTVGDIGVSGGRSLDGRTGEVALWTSVLSAGECAAVLLNGAMAVPGMYLYWPLDAVGTAQARDMSGNARNGTLNGSPAEGENPFARPAGRRG